MKFIVVAALALFVYGSVPTANQLDSYLSRLQGVWNGAGTAFGGKATVQQKWEWVLGDKFFRLSLKYEVKGTDGKTQVFEGHGYYKARGEANTKANGSICKGINIRSTRRLKATRWWRFGESRARSKADQRTA